ncbi:MAG: exodeoxyribonuclease V subunit gamma [Clostridia bacterium]|nr:exodeoxyribonuclease V subunit gamma [Clostridia bacterium]
MSLKIICGRAGSGKSTYMLDDMLENENAIYIVPEQFSFSAEKKIIEKFGTAGLGNPQVLSFMRLADMVFSRYGSPEFVSDNASYEMLVSYCANSITPENLRLFDGLVKKSELSSTASAIITTFKRYRITPEKLRFAIEKTDDALLKKKLSDSLVIYEEYLRELSLANVSDICDKLSVLADIFADSDCDFLDDKSIYIDQFSDFDPSECECIKWMLKRAKRVCVALCTDGGEQFETVNRTYNTLMHIAQEIGAEIEPEENLSSAMIGATPMLSHLEKTYFSDITSPFAGNDGSISVFCGQNRFSEIHNAAREIVRLIRDEKMRYRDISIVARDVEQYKGIIERVFPFYEIPVFLDRKISLSSHSASMFLTSILDIALGGFTYENIFSYIKSPFSPLSSDESDELENYCLATGVRQYSWGKPFSVKAGAYSSENGVRGDEFTPERMEKINSLRERVYTPLNALITRLKRKNTVSELCRYLFDFLNEIGFEKKIKYHTSKLEEAGENLYALQTMQVYNILIDIFNDICSVLGHKELTLREFYTTIRSGLDSVEIGTIPSSSDCVTIGSIDRIKGHGAKVVFLIGVNSGVFPASPSESGLFSDDDKNALTKMGIEMPPNLLHMAQSEELLIYDAITCAGDRLVISYSMADSSSGAMMPSELVERVMELFPDILFTDDITSSPDGINAITSKKAVFDLLCARLRENVTEGKPLSPELSAAAYYFSKDEIYAPLLDEAIRMTKFTNASSIIYSDLVEKAVGSEMKTSITRLESYNKCPFSYFAKYILKLEPKRRFEINASDSGSFLHDFLDIFSGFVAGSVDDKGSPLSWKTIDDEFIKKNTLLILKEVLAGVNSHMLETPRIKALFDRLCHTAMQSVFAVRNHIVKSDFIPMGYEISFDEDGTFKPRKITLPDGQKVILRGRIDRADEFSVTMPDGTKGKFVRIVDYKSSDKTISLADVYQGVQLQLFVYLSALCDNGYSPAGILYCNLSDPMVAVKSDATEEEILALKSKARRMDGIILSEHSMLEHMGGDEILKTKKAVTAKNFNSMFTHINKVIRKTAQDIYGGKFPIRCSDDACTWCEYNQLCRFDTSFIGCMTQSSPDLDDEAIWAILEKEALENEMD